MCVGTTCCRWLWQINRFDWLVWIVTYICTAFVSITIGLVAGVALSCLLAIVQAQRVHGGRLTRAADTEIYYWRPPTATTTSAMLPIGVVVYRSTQFRIHLGARLSSRMAK